MKKEFLLAGSLCLILAACEHQEQKAHPAAPSTPPAAPVEKVEAEKVEVVSDQDITNRIREILSAENSLSDQAKGVIIVTENGIVTLSGPVKSDKEKNKVEKRAKNVEGVKGVNNQIEVIRIEEVEKSE